MNAGENSFHTDGLGQIDIGAGVKRLRDVSLVSSAGKRNNWNELVALSKHEQEIIARDISKSRSTTANAGLPERSSRALSELDASRMRYPSNVNRSK